MEHTPAFAPREPWSKGQIVGQKATGSRHGSPRHAFHPADEADMIYRRTKNLRAVQLLLGHTKLESTVRYLGIEVDDALEMAEQTEV